MLVAEDAVVQGGERLLERIVTNLLDNAVKYGKQGGTVRIELARREQAVVTVRDDGPGILPEHMPLLFARFFRGDPARRRSEGTGLGLAIAKAGAEAHGGRLVFLGNAPGAVFRLSLPLYASAATGTAAGIATVRLARTSRSFQSE